MSLGDGFRPTYVNVEPKFLQGVILTLDQHSIADSFSALIAGTRRVSPLVQKMKNLQKQKKPIRYVSPIEQKQKAETAIHKSITLRHIHEREVFVHWFPLSTILSKTLFTTY